jgi:hypothetical protein
MIATSVLHDKNMDEDPILVELHEAVSFGATSKPGKEDGTVVPDSWLNLVFPEGQADDVVLHISGNYLFVECVDVNGRSHRIKLAEVVSG